MHKYRTAIATLWVTSLFMVLALGMYFGSLGKGAEVTVPQQQSQGYRPALAEETPEQPILDLNTATAEEFMTLPGIGEKLAAAIVAYREQIGTFQTVWQLDAVPGIGEKTMEKILPYLKIS